MGKVRRSAREIISRISRHCRGDFSKFLQFVFDFPLSDMHREWCRALQEHDRLVIIGPRCHAKLFYGYVLRPTGELTHTEDLRVGDEVVALTNQH